MRCLCVVSITLAIVCATGVTVVVVLHANGSNGFFSDPLSVFQSNNATTSTSPVVSPTTPASNLAPVAVKATRPSSTSAATPSSASPVSTIPNVVAGGANGTWYKPSSDSTFLYAINKSPPSSQTASSSEKVVCYFSAGSFENDRPDGNDFESACYCSKGSGCKMDGWTEWWLDIHSSACKANIVKVMTARIALAKTKGCDGVDPDNVDSYTNENGHGNTESDQLSYNLALASAAHAQGLAVGLKNAGDLLESHKTDVVGAFDFAVVEQCEEFNECVKYSPFVKAGKPCFDIEYDSAPKCKTGWFSMQYGESLDLDYANIVATCPKLA